MARACEAWGGGGEGDGLSHRAAANCHAPYAIQIPYAEQSAVRRNAGAARVRPRLLAAAPRRGPPDLLLGRLRRRDLGREAPRASLAPCHL